MDHAPVSPIISDGQLTPTQSSETSRYSDQLSFQTQLGSMFDISHSPVSRTSFGSYGEPLCVEPRPPPSSGHSNGYPLLFIVKSTSAVPTDDHRKINEISEVTKSATSPPGFDVDFHSRTSCMGIQGQSGKASLNFGGYVVYISPSQHHITLKGS